MLWVRHDERGFPVEVREDFPNEMQYASKEWESRWDWETFERVSTIARYLTAVKGELYIPVDNTDAVSPRYDVMKCPKIGDKVSYGFNGDYYPDGEIVSVSKTLQIKTSGGHTYRRKGLRACWLQPGGTWGLTGGHVDERNPHF
jgi:hypothetical protein